MLSVRPTSLRSTARRFLLAAILVPLVALAQKPDIPEEKLACLQTGLAGAGFTAQEIDDLFSGGIANPEEYVRGRLGADAMSQIGRTCFPEDAPVGAPASPPPGTDEHVPTTLALPPDVVACLKNAVGEQVFNEVSGGRPPTQEEMEKGRPCFPQGPPPGSTGAGSELSAEQQQCVIGIIGEETFNQMKSGTAAPDTLVKPEQMRRVGEQCFGGYPGDGQGGSIAPAVEQCLREKFGTLDLQNPTPEQQRLMEECFRLDPRFQGTGIGIGDPTQACERIPDLAAKQQCLESIRRGQPGPGSGTCVEQCVQYGGRTAPECQQLCAGASPPPTGDQCVTQCEQYARERGLTVDCAAACAGQPPPGGTPYPGPTGSPYPTAPPPGDCVQSCVNYGQPREYCEPACRGEPVPPPGSGPTPYPTDFPAPTFSPAPTASSAPAPGQTCTTTCQTDASGVTTCQEQCSGGAVQGAATERSVPLVLNFLLNLLGVVF